MRVVLDACVLYPTVMRELLTGMAGQGLFTPLWSPRILEEWARATRKLGPDAEAQARGEIAILCAQWPEASQSHPPEAEAGLWLPDPGDIHVLALAIHTRAGLIVTQNARDFPRRVLADHGLSKASADAFAMQLWQGDPAAVTRAARAVLAEARRLSGEDWPMRALLKKAGLPRLAKTLKHEE